MPPTFTDESRAAYWRHMVHAWYWSCGIEPETIAADLTRGRVPAPDGGAVWTVEHVAAVLSVPTPYPLPLSRFIAESATQPTPADAPF